MATIEWTPQMLPFDKDPDDVDDYPWDFTDWLAGDTLDGASCQAISDDLTASIASTTSTGLTLRVSGGTLGQTAAVTVRAVSNGGRQADRSIKFAIKSL